MRRLRFLLGDRAFHSFPVRSDAGHPLRSHFSLTEVPAAGYLWSDHQATFGRTT